MKIEEVLHLFTKVEDGLPEHNGWYQVVDMNYYPFTLEMLRYKKYSNEWTNASGDFFHPQYWLDLSNLTTKERAAQLIEEAARDSYEREWIQQMEEVIELKTKLL